MFTLQALIIIHATPEPEPPAAYDSSRTQNGVMGRQVTAGAIHQANTGNY